MILWFCNVSNTGTDTEHHSFCSWMWPKDGSASPVVHAGWHMSWIVLVGKSDQQLPVFITTCKTVYCWIPIWSKTSKTVSSSWLFVVWCACLYLWASALKEMHSKTSGGKAVHMFNPSFLAKSAPKGWPTIYFYVTLLAQLLSATYFSKNLLPKHSKSEEGGWYENVNSDMTVSQKSCSKDCWGLMLYLSFWW